MQSSEDIKKILHRKKMTKNGIVINILQTSRFVARLDKIKRYGTKTFN